MLATSLANCPRLGAGIYRVTETRGLIRYFQDGARFVGGEMSKLLCWLRGSEAKATGCWKRVGEV